MKVFKFGGASVKNAEAVRNVAQIVSNYKENLVVVISAMGKTTNLLEILVKLYFQNDNKKWEIFDQFKKYHTEITKQLFGAENTPKSVFGFFEELELKMKRASSLDFNFEYDQIICFGELVSTCIISEYLNFTGINNKWVDVRTCLITDNTFRDASVDWERTGKLIPQVFNFNHEKIYITQGFIGSTDVNLSTSLGREGSDFSAAIIGNILNAESVFFWKDVPGILTADPKKMNDVLKLDTLSYREAVEMTHSGAKIIHPKTMKPLHNKGIPLYVKSFVSPNEDGTVIHKIDHKIDLPPVFIIRENLVLITLSPKDFSFISIEDIDQVVNYLKKNLVKVVLMQQSAIDLNLVLDDHESDMDTFISEFGSHYSIRYNAGLQLVTIRHYTEETLDWMVKEKDIYLEQHSRLTARMLVKP